jgi:hypothetical protein
MGLQYLVPHKERHALGGSDALTPADIGAASNFHEHLRQDITNLPESFQNRAPLYSRVVISGASPSFLNGPLDLFGLSSVNDYSRPNYEGERSSGERVQIIYEDDVFQIRSIFDGVTTRHASSAEVERWSPLGLNWNVWDTPSPEAFPVTISGKFAFFVPAPAANDNTKFLKGDGTWVDILSARLAFIEDSTPSDTTVISLQNNTWHQYNKSQTPDFQLRLPQTATNGDRVAVRRNSGTSTGLMTIQRFSNGGWEGLISLTSVGQLAAFSYFNGWVRELPFHTHAIADTTGLQAALDSKIPATEKGAANGVATLDANQKLTSSQIPDLAITDFLGACADQAEMLAKTGQKGDWVTRADDGKVYVITGDTPSQASSWTALSYPAAPTLSTLGAVSKAGDTMTGKLTLPAATTASAPINIPHGSDPTSPTNGDIWLNGSLRYRDQAGNTRFVADLNRPNTFSQRQVISADINTTLPALKITQLGNGEALRVEDESPESTPFVVSASGRVGIGADPDTTVALKVDSTGIKFADGTTQTTAGASTSHKSTHAIGGSDALTPADIGAATAAQVIDLQIALDGKDIINYYQLGADIDGENAGDNSGYSVSLNAAGDIVAIGAASNDGNGNASGHVRVYKWNGTVWVQQGTDIDGENTNDFSGWSVSLNAAGDIVAIGATGNNGNGNDSGHVRVYKYNPNKTVAQLNQALPNFGPIGWDRLGADLDGENLFDNSGTSVSLNAAGDIVAIGAWFNDGNGGLSGHVRVYQWNGTVWVQQGTDINGENFGDYSGVSVSLNAAGDIVAIGAYQNDGNGDSSGHVRVYQYNPDKTVAQLDQSQPNFGPIGWDRLGADIDGENLFDNSGWSVSLNAAGDIVAIGANNNDENGTDAGHVRVYKYNPNKTVAQLNQALPNFGPIGWDRLGVDIDGENGGDQSGWSVSLNDAGDIVAIGARLNDGNGIISGHVRVYKWNGTSWIQKGTDIDGENSGDQSGYSVSLNAAGDIVAIGALFNDGNGSNSGHVRVYTTDLQAALDGKASTSVFTGSNGTAAGTAGLVPVPAANDNTKFLKGDGSWALADGLPVVGVENTYVFVLPGDDLEAAYAGAKTARLGWPFTDNPNLRYTIFILPGEYNLTSELAVNGEKIDLVGLGAQTQRPVVTITGNTLNVTANDVRVSGISVGTQQFNIANDKPLQVFENCVGGFDSFGLHGGKVSGTFKACTAGYGSFGGNGAEASGAFTDCTGGDGSFGGFGTASGTFKNCTGGGYSFGGGGTASGTFKDCTGGDASFGGGGAASGTFTNCTGDALSFGADGHASGTFTNCTGGAFSFGADGGTLSGKLISCLTSGSFQAPSGGGSIRLCLDGNNNIVNAG